MAEPLYEIQGGRWTGDATSLATINKPFLARVTGYDGTKYYSWLEVLAVAADLVEVLAGGRYGTLTQNPAYDPNLQPLGIGRVVQLRRGNFDPNHDWTYVVTGSGSAVGSGTGTGTSFSGARMLLTCTQYVSGCTPGAYMFQGVPDYRLEISWHTLLYDTDRYAIPDDISSQTCFYGFRVPTNGYYLIGGWIKGNPGDPLLSPPEENWYLTLTAGSQGVVAAAKSSGYSIVTLTGGGCTTALVCVTAEAWLGIGDGVTLDTWHDATYSAGPGEVWLPFTGGAFWISRLSTGSRPVGSFGPRIFSCPTSSGSGSGSGSDSGSGGGGGGITRTDLGSTSSGGASVSTLTIPSVTVAAGALLLVNVAVVGSTNGVTVSFGTTTMSSFSFAEELTGSFSGGVYQVYLPVAATTTANVVVTALVANQPMMAQVLEVTGLVNNALDKHGSTSVANSLPSISTGSATTVANEYIGAVFLLVQTGGSLVGGSWVGGFTDGSEDETMAVGGTGAVLADGFQVVGSTGTFIAGLTGATCDAWAGGIATYN